jgi:hypothetical protein
MANKRKELNIEGADLWYLVGLVTSDGCLSSDGRHIDITSKDREFLVKLKERLGLTNRICCKDNGTGKIYFSIQFSNRSLYIFLLSIGLFPKKSLLLQKMDVPSDFFCDFLRGLIDGDGGLQRWIHSSNGREQWNLRISSGSRVFLEWLRVRVESEMGVKGKLYMERKNQCRLKYGKMSARVICQACYYDLAFALKRKKDLARACFNSSRGWSQSRTVVSKMTEFRRDVGMADNGDLKSPARKSVRVRIPLPA